MLQNETIWTVALLDVPFVLDEVSDVYTDCLRYWLIKIWDRYGMVGSIGATGSFFDRWASSRKNPFSSTALG